MFRTLLKKELLEQFISPKFLLCLVLYNLIFFAAAYYSFTRYDVR